MGARNQTCHVLAIVAWAVFVACLAWLPSHYIMPPAGARHHEAGLLATIVATLLVVMAGWCGFRSICVFFHGEA
jgi:hypothetical protein